MAKSSKKSAPQLASITKEVVEELARKKWRASGLNDAQARALGLEPRLDKKHPRLRVPYFGLDGEPVRDTGKIAGFTTVGDFYRDRFLEDPARGIFAPLESKGAQDAAPTAEGEEPVDEAAEVKRRRFVQPKATPPHAYFPRGILPRDWEAIAADPTASLLITEGELKAAAGCAAGLPTIGLGGVNSYLSKKWKLPFLPELEAFNWSGRRVTIVYDSDKAYKPAVQAALVKLARALIERGVVVREVELEATEDGAKVGLDDLFKAKGREAVRAAVEEAAPIEELDRDEHATVATIRNVLQGAWGLRDEVFGLNATLEFNSLLKEPVLNREHLDADDAVFRLRVAAAAPTYRWNFGKVDTWDAIVSVAKTRSYHPVVDYLTTIPAWDKKDRMESLARDVLRLPEDDTLSRVLVRKFLIGAVARAMDPGCKMDNVLVLVGREGGTQKSTFFETLAGKDFFADTAVNLRDKDSFMVAHGTWFYEWSELETPKRAGGNTAVKNFISSRWDKFRPPYGRTAETWNRSFVIVGTSNEEEFLTDPTGNRRFWPVPMRVTIQSPLRADLLAGMRDQLWAQAVALYRAGEKWWLDADQEMTLRVRHEEHRQVDGAEDDVIAYLETRQPWGGATSDEILSYLKRHDRPDYVTMVPLKDAQGHPLKDAEGRQRMREEVKQRSCFERRDYDRIDGILTARGYDNKRWTVDGVKESKRKWRHPEWGRPRGNPGWKKDGKVLPFTGAPSSVGPDTDGTVTEAAPAVAAPPKAKKHGR